MYGIWELSSADGNPLTLVYIFEQLHQLPISIGGNDCSTFGNLHQNVPLFIVLEYETLPILH